MNLNCPFCKSRNLKSIYEDKYQYNSYSFILSKYKECTEKELIKDSQPMLCESCSLSFFNNWISGYDNSILYEELVSTHPSCEAILNKKYHFKSEYLISRLINLSRDNISEEIKGKSRREVNSILNSIGLELVEDVLLAENQVKEIINKFNDKVLKADLESILIPGSKYAGFNHKNIEEIIIDFNLNLKDDKINSCEKNNFSYTEIGCPTWGFLNVPKLQEMSLCFSTDVMENYWSDHHEYSNKNYIAMPWKDIDYSNIIGAFACIDHSDNLSEFMQKLFTKTKFIIGTFEKSPVGFAPPIQHHYNLNYESLNSALSSLSFKCNLSTNKSIYQKHSFFQIRSE
ncbi:hypothetical protein [Prochlorococcus marinus]|uniref:hypothetical protein n=1 Tax=Prochlorococcus marinus TaxID=1219 RepID=UPI0022B4266D|nr:hypothetical protein [Prochlorococcus marinus]